jgi:hypothetical protein
MEQVEKFDLNRETNISNNIDATGKKWEITRHNRANALLVARPIPFRSDFQCPASFAGKWTSYDKLQELVQQHVVQTWDQADKATAKAERAKQVLLEAEAFKKAEAKIRAEQEQKAQAKKVTAKKVKAK